MKKRLSLVYLGYISVAIYIFARVVLRSTHSTNPRGLILSICVVIFSLSPGELSAQRIYNDTIRYKKFIQSIEITAGPSFLYPQRKFARPHSSRELKIGYEIKVSLIHPISRKFELCSALSFERKGIKSTSISFDKKIRITGNLTNDYIILSLMPRYIMGARSRLLIGAGFYAGLLNTSKTTYDYDSSGIHKPYYGPAEAYYKKYDAGINFGASYQIPLKGNGVIVVQLLNSVGVVDVGGYPAPSILSMSSNRSLSLVLGLRFKK